MALLASPLTFRPVVSSPTRARWPIHLALVLLVAAWAFEGLRPLADYDLPWQITLGELIVGTGTLVPTDPFSYTQAGTDWPYKDWGTAVLLYGLSATGGHTALVLFKAALLVGTGVMLWWWNARQRAAPAVAALIATGLCIEAASFRFTARGATLSLVIVVGLLLLVQRHRAGKSGLPWAVGLVVLNANLHRGVLLLPVMLAALAVVELLEAFVFPRLRRAKGDGEPFVSRRRAMVATAVALGSALATMATPFGPRLITTTISLMGQHSALLTEWAPVEPWLVARLSPATFGVAGLGAVALLVRAWKGRDAWDVALVVLAFGLGLQSIRHLPYLALLLAGPIASTLAELRDAWEGRLRNVIALGASSAALAAVLARPLPGPAFGLTPAHFPERGVAWVKSLPAQLSLQGRMLNQFGYGGYLIAHLWPEHRVYIDGRTDLIYPSEAVQRYIALSRDPRVFADEVKRWGIEWVLVDNAPPQGNFAHLDANPQWVLVHASRRALVYVRAHGANEVLAQERGYRFVKPHALLPSVGAAAQRGHLDDALAELHRMLEEDPDNIYAAAALAEVQTRLGLDPS